MNTQNKASRRKWLGAAAMAAALSVGLASLAAAQASDARDAVSVERGSPAQVLAYWTPERMAAAQPMPTPAAPFETLGEAVGFEIGGDSAFGDDYEPEVAPRPRRQALLEEDEAPAPFDGRAPEMVAQKGYPFTTRRVSPDTTVNSSPYRRAGKLFFTTPEGNFVCSASVISRRLLVTAAHCMGSVAQIG